MKGGREGRSERRKKRRKKDRERDTQRERQEAGRQGGKGREEGRKSKFKTLSKAPWVLVCYHCDFQQDFFQHIVELFLLFYEAIGPVLLPPILFSGTKATSALTPDFLRMKALQQFLKIA